MTANVSNADSLIENGLIGLKNNIIGLCLDITEPGKTEDEVDAKIVDALAMLEACGYLFHGLGYSYKGAELCNRLCGAINETIEAIKSLNARRIKRVRKLGEYLKLAHCLRRKFEIEAHES